MVQTAAIFDSDDHQSQFEILQKTTALSNSTTPALLNSAALSNSTAFVLLNVAEFDSAFTTENTQIKNGVPKRLRWKLFQLGNHLYVKRKLFTLAFSFSTSCCSSIKERRIRLSQNVWGRKFDFSSGLQFIFN